MGCCISVEEDDEIVGDKLNDDNVIPPAHPNETSHLFLISTQKPTVIWGDQQ